MGMDQYLRAKTSKREYQGATGACNGLFGIAPADNGMVEIGYWRKAYDQNDLIADVARSQAVDDSGHILITKEDVEEILEKAKEILDTHTFDDEGYDITPDYEGWGTWDSKSKWENTIKFFEEAKKIYEEDPKAEIYYCIWC